MTTNSYACPPDIVTASDSAVFDSFGFSTAISAGVAVIGAIWDNQRGLDAGAAYVFSRTGGRWQQQQKLMAQDAQPEDNLGWRVAVDGDRILVSTIQGDGIANGTGAVYVFAWHDKTWNFQQKLEASDGEFGDGFGYAVTIKGNIAVVGAVADDDVALNAGAAYVFQLDGNQWSMQQKLLASDGAIADSFGHSVAIAGDVILVGAPGGDGMLTTSGCAYVFRWAGNTWIQEQKIFADDTTSLAGDDFGWSVSLTDLNGGTALIGAHGDADSGPGNGSAYIFNFDGKSSWSQTQELFPPDPPPGTNKQFGRSVSIDGDRAIVAAPFVDATGSNDGAAYIFRYDDATALWVLQEQLLPEAIPSTSFFGYSVGISGGTAIAGAYGELSQSGRAYIFDVNPAPADLDCDGIVGPDDLAELLAQWGACAPEQDCLADIAPPSAGGDGIVGPADLAQLLANWGEI